MSNTKHTPGPWIIQNEIKDFGPFKLLGTFINAHGNICFVNAKDYGIEESQANAKLIAAAPELLDALRAVLAYEKRGADKGEPRIGNGILSIIHKAIKKATE